MAKEILILTLHFTDGGAERVLAELINEWVKTGCKITIVETAPELFSNSYQVSDRVDYLKFDRKKSGLVNSAKAVAFVINAIKSHPKATVLAFTKSTMYLLAVASFFIDNRIVVSERNDPYSTPSKKSRRFLRDLLFKKADVCVFQTPEARDYFPQNVRDKGIIIPNPINPSIPERFVGEREKIIVAAGRLHPQKNFPMLIKAFALLHNDFPDYRLVIYGRGKQEPELKKLSTDLGVGEYVLFPGFSDNIYQEMRKCAAYVSSSDYEGMSNSMLEALAMGIPSVVTDCPIGGAKMIIKNNVNGVLVPVGDKKAMSEGIRKILSDKKFADSIGKEACKIRDDLQVKSIAEKWLEIM